jgi:hypothetical protein
VDVLGDHDLPVDAPHDTLTAPQLDQHRKHLPIRPYVASSYGRRVVVPSRIHCALGHREAHLAVAPNHIALLDVPPAASDPQCHAQVRVRFHLAELVMPRRRVTVVQDDRVDMRLPLLHAE